MRKLVLLTLLGFALVGFAAPAFADDCVEVDVEMAPEIVAAEVGEGFIEVLNCSDEAGIVMVAMTMELMNGIFVELPEVPVMLGAGEVISTTFYYPAPPGLTGGSFGICVTATLGDAEASDCASSLIVEGSSDGSGQRDFNFSVALSEGDCLEMDFELSDVVYTTPGDFFTEGYYEVTNCGDEAATIWLEPAIGGFEDIGGARFPVMLGAGETASWEFQFPVPPSVPEGTYTFCVTATLGETVVTDCEEVEVRAGSFGGDESSANDLTKLSASAFPNPFNPTTQIAFSLPEAVEVSVSVFNVLGQEVRSLISGEMMAAGDQVVSWDGRDDAGVSVSTGVYLYRIVAGEQTLSKKMVLMK